MSDSQIFKAAVKLPPDKRANYLDHVCEADGELRQEVESLLAAHDRSLCFLKEPDPGELGPTIEQRLAPEPPGTQIGPYKLREQIGEGGFGVVYVAEQEKPVARKVALKIIKPGMDTREVIARFEAERQALALMDHPNIAKVLDAGTTSEVGDQRSEVGKRDTSGAGPTSDLRPPTSAPGRPYFVMELVRGVPITEFCDERKLNTRDRLALFIDVCRAVQHAHQKGIIHRDIKPSNVMVTLHDDKPVVKVIDFGVAKALSSRLTEKTVYTAYGQMVGTPLYMSPEQAQLSGLDVDTRSDVYSLGVLLYELLTGTTPFDKETLKRAGFDEMRRIIREDEPPRPSARISTLRGEMLSTICSERRIDPRKLSQSYRGELDWIVMKALEKDRNRRYESAAKLAEDVERFLSSQPVEACPPSRLYRLRKLARRNRGLLITLASIALALLAGTAVATWQALDAIDARKLADDRLDSEIAARQEADQQAQHARKSAVETRRLLYASDMRLAGEAYRRNDVSRLREILARHLSHAGDADLRGFEWHFLWKQSGMKSRTIFESKQQPLYYVCFSPDGQLLAAAGKDGVIRIFDGKHFTFRGSIPSRQGEVNGLAFSPDSKRLASAGDDGSLVMWDVSSRGELWRITAHRSLAYQVAFALQGKLLVSCGRDNDIRLWDAADGRPVGALQRHSHNVEAIAVSHNDQLVAGSKDASSSVWNLRTKREHVHYQFGHLRERVSCVAFDAAGDFVAEGRVDGLLSLYNVRDKSCVARQSFPEGIQSLAFTTGEMDGAPSIVVGDRAGNLHVLPLDHRLQSTAISPSTTSALQIRQWRAHTGKVYSLAFGPRGELVTAGQDGRILCWNIFAGEGQRYLGDHSTRVAFLDHRRFLSAGPRVYLCDATTGTRRWLPQATGDKWGQPRAARAARMLLARDETRGVFAWRWDGMPVGWVWKPPPGRRVGTFAVSPDARRVAVEVIHPGNRIVVAVIDRASDTVVARSESNREPTLAFSPDSRFATIVQINDGIAVLNAATGKLVQTLRGHRTTVTDVAFSPDGKLLASTSSDRTLRVWDWKQGRELWSVVAHEHTTRSLCFSPDGQTIATVGDDAILRLWRWQMRRLLIELPLARGAGEFVEFTPDGTGLAVGPRIVLYDGSNDGTAAALEPQPPNRRHPRESTDPSLERKVRAVRLTSFSDIGAAHAEKYAFRTRNGYFVYAMRGGGRGTGLWADSKRPGTSAAFHFEWHSGRKLTIRCLSGYYVKADEGGGPTRFVHTDVSVPGVYEHFTLVDCGNGRCAFRSWHGFYFRAESGGGPECMVAVDSRKIGPDETFQAFRMEPIRGK